MVETKSGTSFVILVRLIWFTPVLVYVIHLRRSYLKQLINYTEKDVKLNFLFFCILHHSVVINDSHTAQQTAQTKSQ